MFPLGIDHYSKTTELFIVFSSPQTICQAFYMNDFRRFYSRYLVNISSKLLLICFSIRVLAVSASFAAIAS